MWGLNSVGKQLALAVSGATTLTVPATARHAIIGVDTNDVRWTHDASNPTASNGVLAASGSFLEFMEPGTDYHELLIDLRFIEVTGAPALQVLYFD